MMGCCATEYLRVTKVSALFLTSLHMMTFPFMAEVSMLASPY